MRPKQEPVNVFSALGHGKRRLILERLAVAGALSISNIAAGFDDSRQAISKHIGVLEQANLVTVEAMGKERHYRANIEALNELREWLGFFDQFWNNKLAALQQFVKDDT